MSSSRIVNILHATDLHFQTGSGEREQKIILEAFFSKLKEISATQMSPELFLFSGDLVNIADAKNIYDEMYADFWIDGVFESMRITDKRIVLAPGNHDASRSKVKNSLDTIKQFRSSDIDKMAPSSQIYDELLSMERDVFEGFHYLAQNFANPVYENFGAKVYDFGDLGLAVIAINTALSTFTGLEGLSGDYGNLAYPIECLESAISKVELGLPIIVLGHHPLAWLSENVRREIEIIFDTNPQITMYCVGHVHESIPQTVLGSSGQIIYAQSGALRVFENDRRFYNGFSIIRYDIEGVNTSVHLYKYSRSLRKFVIANDLSDDGGVFYISSIAKKYWKNRNRELDLGELRSWLISKFQPAAIDEYNQGISDQPVGEIFVQPKLSVREESAIEDPVLGDSIVNKNISTAYIAESGQNFIILGKQEYGKTTLLQQIALQIVQNSIDSDSKIYIPVYISFDKIAKSGPNAVVRAINASFVEPPDGFGVRSLVSASLIVLLIDDVDPRDEIRFSLLREFVSKNTNLRFILSCSAESLDLGSELFSESIVPEISTSASFVALDLCPFSKGKFRDLVRKWHKLGKEVEGKILDRIVSEMKAMKIPFTPANGTMLLQIHETSETAKPINRATLIETFVEIVLKKGAEEDIYTKSFDYTNKIDVLCHVSEKMIYEDKYKFSKEILENEISRYLGGLGLTGSGTHIVDMFIRCRILKQDIEGFVQFRLLAFFEYFVGLQMVRKYEFCEYVTDLSRYFSFPNEIQFYASLNRRDSNLVERIGARLDELSTRIMGAPGDERAEWRPETLDNFRGCPR